MKGKWVIAKKDEISNVLINKKTEAFFLTTFSEDIRHLKQSLPIATKYTKSFKFDKNARWWKVIEMPSFCILLELHPYLHENYKNFRTARENLGGE